MAEAQAIFDHVHADIPDLTLEMLQNLYQSELEGLKKDLTKISPKELEDLLGAVKLDRRFDTLDEGIEAGVRDFKKGSDRLGLNLAAQGWRGELAPIGRNYPMTKFSVFFGEPPLNISCEDMAKKIAELFDKHGYPVSAQSREVYIRIEQDGILKIFNPNFNKRADVEAFAVFCKRVKSAVGERKVLWEVSPGIQTKSIFSEVKEGATEAEIIEGNRLAFEEAYPPRK